MMERTNSNMEIIDQISALVYDGMQVVSYKWLSREFCVSSNDAKRLLQEFVSRCQDGIEVVYALSGWTRSMPSCYLVQLVPKIKLQDAIKGLVEPLSVHVYSVQPCLPKDPAQIWSAEYVQSEKLSKEPPEVTNCLRDNRFSGVSCEAAARNIMSVDLMLSPEAGQSGLKRPVEAVLSDGTSAPPRNENRRKQGGGIENSLISTLWGRESKRPSLPKWGMDDMSALLDEELHVIGLEDEADDIGLNINPGLNIIEDANGKRATHSGPIEKTKEKHILKPCTNINSSKGQNDAAQHVAKAESTHHSSRPLGPVRSARGASSGSRPSSKDAHQGNLLSFFKKK